MTDDEILDRMARYAVRRAHTMLPPGEVEDAAQEAVLRVWQRLPKLDPARDPWPLLTKIVRQELAMYARAFYSARETPSEAPVAAEQPSRVAQVPPALSAPLERALAMLSPREREAMVECVAEGRPKVRAAEVMGMSDARVGQLVRQAVPKLRAALAA